MFPCKHYKNVWNLMKVKYKHTQGLLSFRINLNITYDLIVEWLYQKSNKVKVNSNYYYELLHLIEQF